MFFSPSSLDQLNNNALVFPRVKGSCSVVLFVLVIQDIGHRSTLIAVFFHRVENIILLMVEIHKRSSQFVISSVVLLGSVTGFQ